MRIGHYLTLLALCAFCGCARHTTTVAKTPAPPPSLAPPISEATAAAAVPRPPEIADLKSETAGLPSVVGQISGTVTDAAGAAISGVTVRATNVDISQSATTNAAGEYSVSGLPLGTYSLTLTHAGFRTTLLQGITVGVGQSARADVTLAVGAANTAVMVNATAHSPLSTRAKVDAWFKHLPKGSVQYHVPDKMVLEQSYSATTVIYPPGMVPPGTAPPTGTANGVNPAPAANASAVQQPRPLAISTWMRVNLTQPDNPGTFQIDPEVGPCLFVTMDGPTTWSFTVKPLHGGGNKSLLFTAYVVYGDDADSCPSGNPATIELPSDRETVTVKEVSYSDLKQKAVDSFWEDPVGWIKRGINWVKYILPGGAGFIAIGGWIAWWKKRRRPRP